MAGILSKERLIQGFHKLECDFFHRLVHDLGQDPTNMRWVIAFWLWLESAGHHDFVRRAYALPGPVVLRFVEEAVACLRCLAGEAPDLEDARVARLPCTNAFLAQPVDDVGYFVNRRDTVLKGVNYLYKTVCLVVCLGSRRAPADDNTTRAAPTQTTIGSPASADGEIPRRPRGELPTTPTLLRRSPATRAATPPVVSSPARTATQMMISSPRHAAPQMLTSHVHAAPEMMSSPYHAALQMMTAPPTYAPPLMMTSPPAYAPPLMMSAPPEYAPPLMMTAPPAYAPPLMITAPPAYAPPMMMPAPPVYAPPMMMTSPMPLSTLNPMASPWAPIEVLQSTMPEDYSSILPEDYRSLFVTFSKGYPVSKEEILEFFNSTFGPCVETVMLENVQPGQVPMYGRLVLRDAEMIPVVLEGQQTNKFLINGRHLWARVYVPSSRVDVFA